MRAFGFLRDFLDSVLDGLSQAVVLSELLRAERAGELFDAGEALADGESKVRNE